MLYNNKFVASLIADNEKLDRKHGEKGPRLKLNQGHFGNAVVS